MNSPAGNTCDLSNQQTPNHGRVAASSPAGWRRKDSGRFRLRNATVLPLPLAQNQRPTITDRAMKPWFGTALAGSKADTVRGPHRCRVEHVEGRAMSRGLEIDDGRDDRVRPPALHRETAARPVYVCVRARAADPRRRSPTLPDRAFALPHGPTREPVQGRQRVYRLRGSKSHVLTAAGLFRVVFERDVREALYRGDDKRLHQDVAALTAKGLLQRRTVASDDHGHGLGVLALTREGHALLERARTNTGTSWREHQAVHHGWSKPREIIHDASLYRMYQVEAAAIEARGGVIQRVVLDDELKREVFARANRPEALAADVPPARVVEARTERLEEAATRLSLPVVDGHVEFPDLRIEYSDPVLGQTRVDLELVSDAYHKGHVAAKQRAGFALYSAGGDAARGIRSLGGSDGRGGGGPVGYDFISSLLSL